MNGSESDAKQDNRSTHKTNLSEPQSAVASVTSATSAAVEVTGTRVGRCRWMICALLFFAATLNYLDRQVIATLKPTLTGQLGWSEIDYSNIVFAFQLAYAIALIVAGRAMDRLGTRKGFSLAVVFWSVAAMAHALVSSVLGFIVVRFALGLGEAANFPAAIKTVAEWFPKKERALATGIFNAGTNVGIIIAALTVPWIALNFGWRWTFVLTGGVGFVWLFFWLSLYRRPEEHSQLSKAELDYIRSDPPEPTGKVRWARLLPHRQTWAFAIGKFLTDPIWWFYLFWLPDFFFKRFALDLKSIGLPLMTVYIIADVGSVAGGWLSSSLIKRGWSVNAGRKFAMLLCAICVVPIIFAARTPNKWVAVMLVGLAAAAHQGWSANLFTTASDMFPRQAVGSIVGIGGMMGAIGGMVIAKAAGYILTFTGSYLSLFIVAATSYLLALLVIHLLVPRLELAKV
jgi:ACS family hexuronate transporter-like MFS transporter